MYIYSVTHDGLWSCQYKRERASARDERRPGMRAGAAARALQRVHPVTRLSTHEEEEEEVVAAVRLVERHREPPPVSGEATGGGG